MPARSADRRQREGRKKNWKRKIFAANPRERERDKRSMMENLYKNIYFCKRQRERLGWERERKDSVDNDTKSILVVDYNAA
jgi:hypothetical protein